MFDGVFQVGEFSNPHPIKNLIAAVKNRYVRIFIFFLKFAFLSLGILAACKGANLIGKIARVIISLHIGTT